MKIKDTFLAVFPNYGVSQDDHASMNKTQHFYSNFNEIEQRKTADIDRAHHFKVDEFKVYTEEYLKAKNMMGVKK